MAVMEIRRAHIEDLTSIVRIENKSFEVDAWDRGLFLDYLAQSARSVFLAAVIDGKVAGYALAFHSQARAEIHSIAVAPAERGRGVAAALLRRIVALLRRRGFETVSLNVRLEKQGSHPALSKARVSPRPPGQRILRRRRAGVANAKAIRVRLRSLASPLRG
jgi:ribosomal-protein-alanine N-acetyltransferase